MKSFDEIRAEANRELAKAARPIAPGVSRALDQAADDLEYLLGQLQRLLTDRTRTALEQPAGIRPVESNEYTVVEPAESISQLRKQLTNVVHEACTNLERRIVRDMIPMEPPVELEDGFKIDVERFLKP